MEKLEYEKDKNLSVRCTGEFRQALKVEAAKRGITLSDLVLKTLAKEIGYKGKNL